MSPRGMEGIPIRYPVGIAIAFVCSLMRRGIPGKGMLEKHQDYPLLGREPSERMPVVLVR